MVSTASKAWFRIAVSKGLARVLCAEYIVRSCPVLCGEGLEGRHVFW